MTQNKLPKMTDEQRAEALKKAAAVRHARAELRQELRDGKIMFYQALDDERAQGMYLKMLLVSVPTVGHASVADIMRNVGISDTRRVRGMTEGQRERLMAYMKDHTRVATEQLGL